MGTPKTLGAIVEEYVDAQITKILDAEPRLLDGSLADIHPTRVACRRLRSTLRTFDGVYQRAAARRLDPELQWFAAVLGEVRDLDVQTRRLTAALESVADTESAAEAAAALAVEAQSRSRTAWAHVGAALGSRRYQLLSTALKDWADVPPLRKPANRPVDDVIAYVNAADEHLRQRIDRAVHAAKRGKKDAAERAHSARKAGKRHRYAVELATPLLGEKGERLVAQRTELQDVLGEQQDAAIAQIFVADLAQAAGPGARPALDEVARREDQIVAGAARILEGFAD